MDAIPHAQSRGFLAGLRGAAATCAWPRIATERGIVVIGN
jgi:hypothetical protein